LHSWTGIGLGKETPGELAERVKKNRSAKARWQNVKVLIVDEVSMLNCELLEKLDRLAQLLRNNEKPFGGIQLLLGKIN
jgi:ATP-dependent DNA helicase PIF1